MYELKRQFSTVEYREKTHVYQTGEYPFRLLKLSKPDLSIA